MKTMQSGLQLAALMLGCVVFAACGGKKSSPPPAPAPNQLPTANAGPDQTVSAGALVQLTAAASSDPDGTVTSYAWQQTSGPTVVLSNAGIQAPTFQAGSYAADTVLTFTLTVTDNRGGTSMNSESVQITVSAAPNQLPIANAGPDQTVLTAANVQLNGAGSSDPDGGTIVAYSWAQTSGPAVTLSSTAAVNPTFAAPTVASDTTLIFSLSVTDNRGGTSAIADTVSILVVPATNIMVSGKITFARIPMVAGLARLDYANTRQDPARGISFQVINLDTSTAIINGVTDANGDYSIIVPSGTNLRIRTIATMVRAAPLPLPHWNFRVRPDFALADHDYYDASFTTGSTSMVRNVQIPSGFNSAGQLIGTRSAAPFAVLDTVYSAVSTVLTASPNASFPLLTIDWATDNVGGETYYDDSGGDDEREIVISGQLDVDTDEYDQHVVAHEFGHYLEDRFARSDSIGGSHSSGHRLHPSVAFGEGFGTAFASMVLNDSVYRDTIGAGQAQGLSINIENNSQTNPGWWSEGSAYSILWDLFDATADGVDNVALGFVPIWQVMTGDQRITDSITSLFSFVTYLKQQNAGQVAGINSIVSAQNIVSSTIDIYGSTETNVPISPSPPLTSDVLPVFTSITLDGASQTVRSIATYDSSPATTGADQNKLSVWRFLRVVVPTARNVRFVATSGTANRDVNVRVYQRGVLVAFAVSGPAPTNDEDFVVNLAAGTYVIAVYDYRNVISTANNTPITVTATSN